MDFIGIILQAVGVGIGVGIGSPIGLFIFYNSQLATPYLRLLCGA